MKAEEEKIELIKAEIKRQIKEYSDADNKVDVDVHHVEIFTLQSILDFIDKIETEAEEWLSIYNFKEGDIIYIYGDDDCWPTVLRLPYGFKKKNYFQCEMVIDRDDEWESSGEDIIEVKDNMRCRKANDQEVEIFGRFFELEPKDLPYGTWMKGIDVSVAYCPACGEMIELSSIHKQITLPDGSEGIEVWCPECEQSFYAK